MKADLHMIATNAFHQDFTILWMRMDNARKVHKNVGACRQLQGKRI